MTRSWRVISVWLGSGGRSDSRIDWSLDAGESSTSAAPGGTSGIVSYLRPSDWKVCNARDGTSRVSPAITRYWAPGIE